MHILDKDRYPRAHGTVFYVNEYRTFVKIILADSVAGHVNQLVRLFVQEHDADPLGIKGPGGSFCEVVQQRIQVFIAGDGAAYGLKVFEVKLSLSLFLHGKTSLWPVYAAHFHEPKALKVMMRELFCQVVVLARASSVVFKYSKVPAFPTTLFNLAQTPQIGKRSKSSICFGFLAEARMAVPRKAISAPKAQGFHPNANLVLSRVCFLRYRLDSVL
jgi:hypothetical protein